MIDKNSSTSRLLWLDMEMSGLDPLKDRILEIATIVTDVNFNIIDSYESVVYQPDSVISTMNQWCKETHTASGLVDRIKAAPNEKHVEQEFVEFVKNNFKEPAVLAGNSIHQDRQFIRSWWPEVEKLLHYRMVDVSSFKVLMQSKYGLTFEKKEVHRALDDINESIAELKFYLKYFRI